MLSLYVDHGSPMNALEKNSFTTTLKNIGKSLKKKNIKRIIIFSAHFLRNDDRVEISTEDYPHMVYDMVSFPDALYKVKYTIKSDLESIEELSKTLEENRIQYVYNKHRWIDHGIWSILTHLLPETDIPIIAISTSMTGGEDFAFRIGEILSGSYDDSTLLLASGTIVHNLSMLDFGRTKAFSWAEEFDKNIENHLNNRAIEYLKHPHDIPWWVFSVPTRDHYLPFLTFVGSLDDRAVQLLHRGFSLWSISERIYSNF